MHDPILDTRNALLGLQMPVVSHDDTRRADGLLVEIENETTEWRSIADKWYLVTMAVTSFFTGDMVEDEVAAEVHKVRDAVEKIDAYLLHSSGIEWQPPDGNELSAKVTFTLRYRD